MIWILRGGARPDREPLADAVSKATLAFMNDVVVEATLKKI